MDITPLVPRGQQIITGYGGGGFRISGAEYSNPVLLLSGQVMAWDIPSFSAVTEASLAAVTAMPPGEIELLIIGSGARQEIPPVALKQALKKHGIGLEVMNTGAACRTFNVLIAEARRVAAALIPV